MGNLFKASEWKVAVLYGSFPTIFVCVCVFKCACVCSVCLTHWIENHCKEELSATDAFVQLFGSTGVFFIVDGVSKQATCLTGQHLRVHTHTHTHAQSALLGSVFHIGGLH